MDQIVLLNHELIDELVNNYINVVDVHHRCIEPSILHNPRENIDFWKCECLPCKRAADFLKRIGFDIEKYFDSANQSY